MNETIEYQKYPKGNRKYKDTVFQRAFVKKKDLLDLYNAVNGTDYQNEEELVINTLQDAVYMYMKNDVSFIVDCRMNLYEHQSTVNPNMPLRGLLYFSKLYETYVELHEIDVYSSTLQKLPTPRYIVFYNGMKEEVDKRVFRLSEAFENGEGCLECEATVLNINYGHNHELLEKCKRLEECIAKGILKDILEKQKAEVVSLVLTTFNRELYERNLKKDAHEAGYSEGKNAGAQEHLEFQVKKKLDKGKSVDEIIYELEEDEVLICKTVEKLCKENRD